MADRLWELLESEYPDAEALPTAAALRGEATQGFPDAFVTCCRREALTILTSYEAQRWEDLDFSVANRRAWQPALLAGFIRVSRDPDDVVPEWFASGAPTGIARDIPLRGVFPTQDHAPERPRIPDEV